MTIEQKIQKALAIRFDSDAGDGLTLRQYFQELLATLWNKDESFSGKRPFGNSGWQWRIKQAISLGLADLDPNGDDADEGLEVIDDDFVLACITVAFEPATIIPDDSLRTLLNAVGHEVQRARGLFPDPNLLALAHAEEAGELTKAILEEPLEDVRKEAIQAAAMALRLVLDGDPSTDAHRERQGLKKLGRPVDVRSMANTPRDNPHLYTDKDGDLWCRGSSSDQVIHLEDNRQEEVAVWRRSDLDLIDEFHENALDCARCAFIALWDEVD